MRLNCSMVSMLFAEQALGLQVGGTKLRTVQHVG